MVLGHRYPIRAKNGAREEARVREAAALLSERIAEIEASTGEMQAQHLAVMAALALADELIESRQDHRRAMADDAVFRKILRDRSEGLLDLVEEELTARLEAAS